MSQKIFSSKTGELCVIFLREEKSTEEEANWLKRQPI